MPDHSPETISPSTSRSTMSTITPPSPSPHPFLHPDILPLILSFASDTTLAHLMQVSREVLSDIVSHRWPVVTYDPSDRRTILRSRTSLPDHVHRFSAPMQILLTHYARMAIILPHPAYSCPPRTLQNTAAPLAHTVQVDRRGLCRSSHSGFPPPSFTSDLEHHILNHTPCELFRKFSPTTIRIDGIHQHPLIPIPRGLIFAPSVTRLLLCIEPGAHFDPAPADMPDLYRSLSDNIAEVVFLLAQPSVQRSYEYSPKDPKVSLEVLSEAIARWVTEGSASRKAGCRTWTIVGAERLNGRWLPKLGDGEPQVDGTTAVRQAMTRVVQSSGVEASRMERVQFVTLLAYLRSGQTRSELRAEEISAMTQGERSRLAKLEKEAKGNAE